MAVTLLHMDKPSRALVAGVMLAAGFAAIASIRVKMLDSHLTRLEQECAEQSIQDRKKATPGSADADFELICDRHELNDASQFGIQGRIGAVNSDRRWWLQTTAPVAVTVVIALAVPWIWYFLLGRIRELRDAIMGAGPR